MSSLADSPGFRRFPALKRVPEYLLSHLCALTLLAAFTALSILLLAVFGRPVAVLFVLFEFVVVFGAAWLGYSPGILVCTLLTFAVAPMMSPRAFHASHMDLQRFGVLLLISILVSRIGQMVRQRQQGLERAAEELERRVQQRTAEALQSADARREVEYSLREQAQLLELAKDAILAMDGDGTIHFWNSGAEAMYGWTR